MRYIPSFTVSQIKKDKEDILVHKANELNNAVDQLFNMPVSPISDHTNFLVTATTIDTNKMDKRFNDRNALFLLAVDKFSALAALQPTDEALRTLIWQDMLYAIKFDFWNRAERKAIEIIQLYNETRGRAGVYNFSEQMITTKQVLISKHKQELEEAKRKGSWGFMRKRPPGNPGEALQQVYGNEQ
jgi:hypothetical protein